MLTAPPGAVRAALAHAALALPPRAPAAILGDVTLHPHQRLAVARLAAALHVHRAALLADDVGTGKTFVALALARSLGPAVIVAPAALRDTWRAASRRADVSLPFVSVEALSHPTLGDAAARALAGAALLVLDESHHLRNPHARRWRRLADLARRARVLCLSATPIHNATHDLLAPLALALGARAHALDASALARLVVRRRRPREAVGPAPAHARLPAVAPTRWHHGPDRPDDLALRDAILALPPPLPPRDGGHAAALGHLTMLRLLASSADALRAGVRRRLARAAALDAALADGRHLDAATLRRWCGAGGDPQLGFALDAPARDAASLGAMRAALARHAQALYALRARLDARDDLDAPPGAVLLRALRARDPGSRIVAFAHAADTARACWRALAADGGVALLTARGGRIATGPIARRELLARFAPLAAGLPPPPPRERVDLLLATDCLSEGLDLRDASVVVHLDVPWTPARLAQRAGRCARLGAPHARVIVHGVAPLPAVARALRLAERLRAKARSAARVVGGAAGVDRADLPARHVRVAARLERWVDVAAWEVGGVGARPVVGAVRAARAGALVACELAGEPVLLVVRGRRVLRSGRAVLRALCAGEGAPGPAPSRVEVRRVVAVIGRWARRRDVARAVAGPGGVLLARVDRALARLPPHRRAARAVDAARLRAALAAPLPAGVERALGALPGAFDGEAWLDAALGCLGGPAESPRVPAPYGLGPEAPPPVVVRALLLLVPGAPAAPRSNHSSPRPV